MPVTEDDEFMTMSETQSTTSKAEQRKSNKPIMEKRRRARINHCLNELKSLILNAMKKDPARHSKLEKADILEMTVKHLQTVQRQQLSAALATDPTVITKFRSGFDECAAEVSRYISRLDGVEHGVKQRLSAHLHRCVSSLQQMTPPNQSGPHDDNNNSSSQRTLLIPSRLPTGQLALVLPDHYSSAYLPSAHSSAFKTIKAENQQLFQPFKVEIPNSHLTAHISIPEGFEKKNSASSPKKMIHTSPAHMEVQRPQVSSSQSLDHQNERLHLPSLSEDNDFRRQEMNHPSHRVQPKPETSTRLHAALISQKPNPHHHLNPKLHSTSFKFVRNGELPRPRPPEGCTMGPTGPKLGRYSPTPEPRSTMGPTGPKLGRYSPTPEPRSTVIVSDTKEHAPSSSSNSIQENQPTNRDMWRPW